MTSEWDDALKAAAQAAYRTCAETRHMTLGDKCSDAILSLQRPETPAQGVDLKPGQYLCERCGLVAWGGDHVCRGAATTLTPPAMLPAQEIAKTPAQFVAELLNDYNVKNFLSMQICCNGQHCGCQGATVGSYLEWIARDEK